MKRDMLVIVLCLLLAAVLSACKKSATNEGTAQVPVSDDTQSLQRKMDAGDVVLETGRTYSVTGLNITHSVNMNGATIKLSSTRAESFTMIVLADNVEITNGTITGLWNNQTQGGSSGYSGVGILANNCSVSHVNISGFSGFGMLAGAFSNTSVTYCSISNTGYIGFFFDAQKSRTRKGVFSNNTVDRSMISPASVLQMAIGIRGDVSDTSFVTSDWVVSNNLIRMPVKPFDPSAEGMELRSCNNSLVQNNTVISGSIGISIVTSVGVTVTNNASSNVSREGIEFADCNKCASINNVIDGSGEAGELLDGNSGCSDIRIVGEKISGTKEECIHVYYKTKNLTIANCTLSTSTPGTFAVNLQNASSVSIKDTKINGNRIGAAAVQLDNCPGELLLTGGSISDFQLSVVYIYNSTPGLITDNISMSGVSVTNVPQALVSVLINGGQLGPNIHVSL